LKQVALILLCFFLCVLSPAAAEKDVVILLDVSQSVFSEFTSIREYLIKGTLEKQMDLGDYFHLLTFADDPRVELSRRINSEEDIEAVLKEILLLYPFGQYTDLVAALQFLNSYTESLPDERKKVVVILTDGIHDPPPGRYEAAEGEDGKPGSLALQEAAEAIREKDWDVNIVEMPSDEDVVGEEDERDAEDTDSAEKEPGTAEDQKEGRTADEEEGLSVLTDELDTEPYQYDSADGESMTDKIFDGRDGGRDDGKEAQSASGKTASPGRLTAFIILGIAAIALLVVIFIVLRRKSITLSTDFKKKFRTIYYFHYSHLKPGERPIEMHVEGQNTNIGLRNVQAIKEGKRLCVGGRGSSFLIFLVPLPRCVGVIERKNDSYRFVPLKSEYFPDGGSTVENCLDQDLVLISEHGKRIVFRFSRYVSKLEKINKIMHLIDRPGIPE
jgi:hypothetical protein